MVKRHRSGGRKPLFHRVLSRRIATLLRQELEAHREREILERTLSELQAKETPTMALVTVTRPPKHVGHNAVVIGTILSRAGKPLAIKDVARIAYDQKLIQNAKEYRGVYNIVQSVIRRNSRNGSAMFIKLDDGNLWDLRERYPQRAAQGH